MKILMFDPPDSLAILWIQSADIAAFKPQLKGLEGLICKDSPDPPRLFCRIRSKLKSG
jgi:hypothetical protein